MSPVSATSNSSRSFCRRGPITTARKEATALLRSDRGFSSYSRCSVFNPQGVCWRDAFRKAKVPYLRASIKIARAPRFVQSPCSTSERTIRSSVAPGPRSATMRLYSISSLSVINSFMVMSVWAPLDKASRILLKPSRTARFFAHAPRTIDTMVAATRGPISGPKEMILLDFWRLCRAHNSLTLSWLMLDPPLLKGRS